MSKLVSFLDGSIIMKITKAVQRASKVKKDRGSKLASFLGGIIIMKIMNAVVNIAVPRVMIFDNEFYVLVSQV